MARPKKSGLDYFPLDVDIDQDDKVIIIIAKYGMEGFGVFIKLMMEVYKNSYFYNWTEKEQIVFSSRVNVNINTVQDLVNDCIKWGFFNKTSFEDHSILTSKGIQERYLLATARRLGAEIDEKYRLVEVNVDINSSSSGVNEDKSTQKKRKEIKVKDTINTSSSKDDLIQKEFDDFWSIYKKKTDKKKALEKFKAKRKKFSFEEIITGTKLYMYKCDTEKTDKQYIKGAAVFLNGDCFLDEHEVYKKNRTGGARVGTNEDAEKFKQDNNLPF